MIYKIDQSGKVEEIGKDTILAISNGHSFAIKITSKTKIALKQMFNRSGRNKIYVYKIFSILVYILIVNCGLRVREVIIDEEYSGQNKLIKDMVSQLLTNKGKEIPEIYFARIGNRPKVHYAAYNVFIRKIKADKVCSLEEVINLTTKKDRGLK